MARIGGATHDRYIYRAETAFQDVKTSLERLSTGKRINRPADDPAGFVAAELMRSDIVELEASDKAIERSIQASRQKEAVLSSGTELARELQSIALDLAGNTITKEERKLLRQRIDAVQDAAGLVSATTGAGNALRGFVFDADEMTAQELEAYAQSLESGFVNQRASLGAEENAMLSSESQLTKAQIVNSKEALSSIEDVDFAQEAASLFESRIISEASLAALGYNLREAAAQVESVVESLDVEA